ncbi:MAG: carboxypeptidase regulatory-like domain-containing protein [Prevotella sp.]|nr:carboxypeptidase regulatory-like domain-containing protein [Prevotella sp.]
MKKIRLLFLTLVALMGGVVSSSGKTVYIQPGAWSNDDAIISVNVWGDGSNTWVENLTEVETGIFKATFDDAKTTMAVVRGTEANKWKSEGAWNQTGDIAITDGKLYKLYDWDNSMDDIYVGHGIVEEDYTEPTPDTSYLMDFNTAITTSKSGWVVGRNWGHIVDNASYSYSENGGVDGSGALTVYNQNSGYDLLITPVVSGTVTIQAKVGISSSSSNHAFVNFYALNSDATAKGDVIQENDLGYYGQASTEWQTLTINVTEGQRIGIHAQYVELDNFTASEVAFFEEAKMEIVSAVSSDDHSGTTGTIYWEQQSNGKVLVSYTVTVKNTGDATLNTGDDNYSISIINASNENAVVATVNVPQTLAVGETSDAFVVSAEVETSLWPNSYTYNTFNLKENITGTTVERPQSHYTAYEPKFVFRLAGSTNTSSIESMEYGTVSEATTKDFEIYNNGIAPLTIKSITLPTGFTSDNVIAPNTVIPRESSETFSITLPFVAGDYSDNLKIVYLDKNGDEQTYQIGFTGKVKDPNIFVADFDNPKDASIVWPEGCVVEAGINATDYDYKNGVYNFYLRSFTNSSYATANNKFITPRLHANAGDVMSFDVKRGSSSSSSYNLKVYVSTDRKSWGEPVATYNYSELTSSYENKSISFDTAGDFYVAFAVYGVYVDNISGLTKLDLPEHDLYIKSVNWPDASIKSGTAQTKPSVDIIPLTTETADAYTVKYVCGETILAEGTPVGLTATVKDSETFSFSWTPEVESTTEYPATKVVFEFTDGTKFETETFDLTVTNEPIFHFLKTLPTTHWYEPSDYTTPITFGKTNSADVQTYYINNWGSAPLTVNSIALPAGFTTSVEAPLTIAAYDGTNEGISAASQALDIIFSATEAGEYSGNMVITYVDGAGADQTFTLAVSGTKFDPTKFYANFDDGNNNSVWPAGSVYNGLSLTNGGTYSTANYYVSGTGMFVTPKMIVAAGDKMTFDAKLYSSSSYYADGSVTVYVASTRDEVMNAEEGTTRTQVFKVSGEDTENPITTDYQTFEVTFADAGEYYIGFDLYDNVKVDEIYGLTVADVEHDWKIASSNIPTEAMQNVASTATVKIQNLGLADEAADSYTVTAYINGEAAGTGEAVALPMNHKLGETEGTQLSVSFMSTQTGIFPVYLEVKAGEYSVQTAPIDVVFAAEEVKTEADMATNGTTYEVPLYLNYKNSESVTMYNAEALADAGLIAGSKIKKITYKGYKTTDVQTTSFQVYYKWTDEQTLAQPANTYPYAAADNGMTKLIDEDHTWAKVGSSNEMGDMIVLDFTESPLTYESGKSLVVYMHSYVDGYKAANFEKSTLSSDFCYRRYADAATLSSAFSKAVPAAIHFTLDATAATLAGTVTTSAGAGIEGATVTLKAENGVTYSGTTAADGTYNFNVIQAGLNFTATVEAEGYLKNEFAYSLGGESKTLDITMYKSFGIVGTLPGFDWDNDKVMTQSTEDPNIFTLLIEDVEVTTGTYAFKLRADGLWNTYQLPAAGGNYVDDKNGYNVVDGNYEWEFKTAGTYNFLFTFDWTNHTLTFERPFTLAEDNTAEIADLNWVDVTVEREFKAGWNAVVLPFDLSAEEVASAFGTDAEVAYYAGDEANAAGNVTVTFNKRSGIDAGAPCLLWLENAVSGLKFTKNISSTLWPTEGATFDFVGVYTTTDANAGDYFVAGGTFKKATSNNTVKPFRAYLKLKNQNPNAARSVTFVIGDQTTTEIEGLEIEGQRTVEGVYNLQGQKVQNMNRKGLYIINGKKVMVK